MRTLFVNVYKEERCYGGSEEGGWWYSSYNPLEFKIDECDCDLPISEWPLQDERGDFVGWHVELDAWVGHHKESCYCVELFNTLHTKWNDYKDEWYPQQTDDDSDPRRGESFSSGRIWIGIELARGKFKPEYAPMYS